METKLLLVLILAVALPAPSYAQLRNCPNGYANDDILILSEVSENAFFAAADVYDDTVTVDQNYLPYNQQFSTLIQAILSTNTPIRVGTAYFGNELPNGFIWNQQFLTSPQSADFFTGRMPSDGGVLLSGLQRLNQLLLSRNSASPRMNLGVIYASGVTSNTDPVPIANLINSFRTNYNVYVYLFAVGTAIDNGNLLAVRNALTDPTILVNVPSGISINGLGNLLSQQLIRCGDVVVTAAPPVTTQTPVVDVSVCDDCLIDQSSALIRHESRCDWYIHCARNEVTKEITAVVKQCRHGTLFDPTIHTCNHERDVLGKDKGCSWCSQPGRKYPYRDSCAAYQVCVAIGNTRRLVQECCSPNQYFDQTVSDCRPVTNVPGQSCPSRLSRYPDAYACRGYYQCEANTNLFSRECCPAGSGFNATTGTCDVSQFCHNGKSCRDPADYACLKEPVDQCNFRFLAAPNDVMECAQGTYYNQQQCECLGDNEPLVDGCRKITPPVCDPDFRVTLANEEQFQSWGLQESSGLKRYFGLKGSPERTSDQKLRLNGTQYGLAHYYANNDRAFIGQPVFFRLDFKDDVSNGVINQEMWVLSNTPCDRQWNEGKTDPSVYITVNPSTRTVTYGVRTVNNTRGNSTTIQYPPSAANTNAWKEVTLRYDSRTGLMEAGLRLYNLNNGVETELFRGTSSAVSAGGGDIEKRKCAVKIGRGGETDPMFIGLVDNIYFYDDCLPTQVVPAVDATSP